MRHSLVPAFCVVFLPITLRRTLTEEEATRFQEQLEAAGAAATMQKNE